MRGAGRVYFRFAVAGRGGIDGVGGAESPAAGCRRGPPVRVSFFDKSILGMEAEARGGGSWVDDAMVLELMLARRLLRLRLLRSSFVLLLFCFFASSAFLSFFFGSSRLNS